MQKSHFNMLYIFILKSLFLWHVITCSRSPLHEIKEVYLYFINAGCCSSHHHCQWWKGRWVWWCHRSRSGCTEVSSRHQRLPPVQYDQTDDPRAPMPHTDAPQRQERTRSHRLHERARWPWEERVKSYKSNGVWHTFLQKPDFHLDRRDLLLVRLLVVGPIRTFTAVIRLDGEAVLLLAFTVQRLLGPNQTFSSGAI